MAVNEHNGHLLWHSNAEPGPLLAADGIVLAETTNGRHLVALHESDGSPAWTSTGFPPDRAVSTFDNLAAADGVGYSQHVSRTGSDVYAFGLATGSPIWHQAPRSGGVAVAGDDVYATSLSQLCAYESATGTQRWCSPADVAAIGIKPSITRHLVFAVDAARTGILALNRSTGHVVHHWAGLDTTNGMLRAPMVVGDTVYTVGRDGIAALRLPQG